MQHICTREEIRPGEVRARVEELEQAAAGQAELLAPAAALVLAPAPAGQAGAGEEGEAARRLLEGNRIDMRPFTDAVVSGPVPGPPLEDTEGWCQLDAWGAWQCGCGAVGSRWGQRRQRPS